MGLAWGRIAEACELFVRGYTVADALMAYAVFSGEQPPVSAKKTPTTAEKRKRSTRSREVAKDGGVSRNILAHSSLRNTLTASGTPLLLHPDCLRYASTRTCYLTCLRTAC